MNSSESIFTSKNPFPPEAHKPKSYYHPSRVKKIPKQQKKLALSPVRFTQQSGSPESPHPMLITENRIFSKGSNHDAQYAPSAVEGHQNFPESWPSTDQSSSSSTPNLLQPTYIMTNGTEKPSVLAKYVERFRYGRPQSRRERQRQETDDVDGQSFWWLSSPQPRPSSSTPTRTNSKECFRDDFASRNVGSSIMDDLAVGQLLDLSLSPSREQLDPSMLAFSETSLSETAEPELIQLQERANRLLQKSENSLCSGSSSVPISSEGLDCSDFSSPVSVDEPVRRPVMSSIMDTALLTQPVVLGPTSSAIQSVGFKPRPEDDILFQWRLRRKMEQARQWSQTSTQSSVLDQLMFNRAALQKQPGIISPHALTEVMRSPPSQPIFQPLTSVSSNLQPEPTHRIKEDSILQDHSVPVPPSVTRTKEVIREPETLRSLPHSYLNEENRSTESSAELYCKHPNSTASSTHTFENPHQGGIQQLGTRQVKDSKDKEKRTREAVEVRRKKKSHRCVEDRNRAQSSQCSNGTKSKSVASQEHLSSKLQKSSKENLVLGEAQKSHAAAPPSPIRNTLGQVVAEVLFPGADSTTPSSSCSPVNTLPAASPPPAPCPQHEARSCEVVNQLMQDAEDSDGLEFVEDPLLVVLREQRKWVKRQLCEIDVMLKEVHQS